MKVGFDNNVSPSLSC